MKSTLSISEFPWPFSLDLQDLIPGVFYLCKWTLTEDTSLLANVSTNLLAVFFFSLQLPWRGCAQHLSSITTQVALGVKLGLAGLKEVLFLLRQATGTGQVRMAFQFYSVCHH